jgi:hypothetical protein
MRIFLKYSAGLIALYLAVAYASGSGTVISKASSGAANLVKTFQARA